MVVFPSILCKKTQPFVKFVLDTKLFSFISRLVLWAYLLHLTLTFQFLFTRNNELYFEIWSAYPIFVSLTASSIILGLFFYILV